MIMVYLEQSKEVWDKVSMEVWKIWGGGGGGGVVVPENRKVSIVHRVPEFLRRLMIPLLLKRV